MNLLGTPDEPVTLTYPYGSGHIKHGFAAIEAAVAIRPGSGTSASRTFFDDASERLATYQAGHGVLDFYHERLVLAHADTALADLLRDEVFVKLAAAWMPGQPKPSSQVTFDAFLDIPEGHPGRAERERLGESFRGRFFSLAELCLEPGHLLLRTQHVEPDFYSLVFPMTWQGLKLRLAFPLVGSLTCHAAAYEATQLALAQRMLNDALNAG